MLPRPPCSRQPTQSSMNHCTNCVWGPAVRDPRMEEMSRNRLAVRQGWRGKKNSMRRVCEEVRFWEKKEVLRVSPQMLTSKRESTKESWGRAREGRGGGPGETGELAIRGDGGPRGGGSGAGVGGLTQDSVQRVPHVNRVELGGRQGAAHGPVRCGASEGALRKRPPAFQTAAHGSPHLSGVEGPAGEDAWVQSHGPQIQTSPQAGKREELPSGQHRQVPICGLHMAETANPHVSIL